MEFLMVETDNLESRVANGRYKANMWYLNKTVRNHMLQLNFLSI